MIRKIARRTVRTAAFAAAAGGIVPIHAVHELFTPRARRNELRERYKRAWCEAMLHLFGIRLHVIGRVPDPGGMAIVSNHRSAIDIAIMFRIFGGHMLSRADISGWPLLGTLARKTGTVFVDRSSKMSGAAALHGIIRVLEAGERITIFAEGTTFEGDTVHPFHPGAFIAAARANVPVLPVGIAYARGSEAAYVDETFMHHLGRVASAAPSDVTVVIGEPMAPQREARKFAEAVRAEVGTLIARARREDPSP